MRYFPVLCAIVLSISLHGQIPLSESAKVSIITCAPGQRELYSAFGHSAIRVYDPVNQIDYAYNYGTFDFNRPNFYLNFTKGNLMYQLAVQPYPGFKSTYLYYHRWVHEQILSLNHKQRQKIFDYLQWNALPENRDYLYDYFYNNCATMIRDVFAKVLQNDIRFDDSHITTEYTIRNLTDLYLTDQPWGDLGIDICLGLPMDKKASPYEYMFLPDYIESSFHHATIVNDSGSAPIVKDTIVSNPSRSQKVTKVFPHPRIIFGIVLILIAGVTYSDFRKNKLTRWLDVTLLTITGLLGWLLLLLWMATDHKAAANNFNIMWALPTNIMATILLFKSNKKFLMNYFGVVSVLTALLLLSWPFLPQQLNIFLIPLVIAFEFRYVLNYRILKQSTCG